MPRTRLFVATVLAAVALSSTSCTLAKPFVCAVTAPVYVLGQGDFCGCHCDGEAALCGIAVVSVIGAVGGLVTGIISDINFLTGRAEDPTRNFHDPFATNTSGGSF